MNRFVGLILIALTTVGCSPPSDGQDDDGHFRAKSQSAWSYLADGDVQTAERVWNTDLDAAVADGEDELAAECLYGLSFVQQRAGRTSETIVAIMERGFDLLGPASPFRLMFAQRLSNLYNMQGSTGKAEALWRRVGDSYPDDSDLGRTMRGEALIGLARHYRKAGMLDDAERTYLQAIEVQKGMSDADMGLVHSLQGLVEVYASMKAFDAAADTCAQAVAVLEGLADHSVSLLRQTERCVQLFKQADRTQESQIFEVRAEKLRDVIED